MLVKLLTSVFFPPGGIVLLLLAGSALILLKRKKTGIFLVLFSTIILYFLSTKLVSEALLLPLETSESMFSGEAVDAIVILGGGTYSYCPDGICLSESSIKRAVFALSINREGKIPFVVCGAKVVGPYSDASAIAKFLRLFSMAKIFVLEGKINTMEQAIAVKLLMKKMGWEKVVLVTSAFHMKRAIYSFKKLGIDVIPAPTDFRTDRKGSILFYLLPSTVNLRNSCVALHEYLGLIYYKIL